MLLSVKYASAFDKQALSKEYPKVAHLLLHCICKHMDESILKVVKRGHDQT